MPTSSDIFLFGKFRFDRAGGGLFERDDRGAFAPVTIGSRALDLLAVLDPNDGATSFRRKRSWPPSGRRWRSRRAISSLRSRRFARSSIASNRAKAASRPSPGAAIASSRREHDVQRAWMLGPRLARMNAFRFSVPTAPSLLSHWRKRAPLSRSRRRFHPPSGGASQ